MSALREGEHEVEVEYVTLRGVDGATVPAIHARPLGMPVGGVVVGADIHGLRPLFEDLCRRLATHGLAVCAPEPWARIPEAERVTLGADQRQERVRDLVDEVQVGDLEAAADRLVVADDVPRVGVIGFCIGGMYALKAAATDRFDSAVVGYGMIRLPEQWRGPGQRDALDTAADACATFAAFGGRDPYTPAEDIDALRAVWAGRPAHEIVVYPDAEHGFVHDPERPAHRPDDAADVWTRALRRLGA